MFWNFFPSCKKFGSKVVWGRCGCALIQVDDLCPSWKVALRKNNLFPPSHVPQLTSTSGLGYLTHCHQVRTEPGIFS